MREIKHQNLVDTIKQLENSAYVSVRKKATKELVNRLKEKGFSNKGL